MMTLSVTKFVRCAIYHRKMDAAVHFISKPYPGVIPGFDECLIKENAFSDLCDKTLGILSFYSATRRRFIMGKYVLRSYFDEGD